jgi:uncharacterized damage-inducible protein DinB
VSPIAYPRRPEPPREANEVDTLYAMLDYYRATLVTKCAGLSDVQLRQRSVPTSELTLMGILRHMCDVESYWFSQVFAGSIDPTPFDPGNTGVDFYNVEDHSGDEVMATFESCVVASRLVLGGISLDATGTPSPKYGVVNLRYIVVHMIEEYARHCGHADFLREAIDGSIGD